MSVMDFRDDLANLHGSGPDSADHSYRHNIFDVSAPSTSSPHSQLNFNHEFHNPHHTDHHQQSMQQHHHHAYLNSTLPALNSSMRYDPLPPPDSFGFSSSAASNGLQRHTPSPIDSHTSRQSRSRSRPPTAGPTGVVRTTRTRRTGSMSSTSPPPPNGTSQWGIDFAMQRPGAQAIVIPRSQSQSGHGGGGGTPVSPVSAGWDYSLPAPENMGTSHSLPPLHHHHGSFSNGYSAGSGFGLGISPGGTDMGLAGTPSSLASSALSGSSPTSNGPDTPPSATATTGGKGTGEKHTMLASEKRRRRRESHNAVERRRRDNINEKIGELATLIPITMLAADGEKVPNGGTNGLITIPITPTNTQDLEAIAGLTSADGETSLSDLWNGGKDSSPSGETRDGSAPPGSGSVNLPESGVVKANKGMILRKSVEYIRYLQQIVTAQGARNRELEEQLRAYREGPSGHHPNGTKTPTPGSIGSFSSYGVSGSITGIGMAMFGASLEDLPEHLEEPEEEQEVYRGRTATKGSRASNGKRVHNVDAMASEGEDEEMELIGSRGNGRTGGEKEVKMEL